MAPTEYGARRREDYVGECLPEPLLTSPEVAEWGAQPGGE